MQILLWSLFVLVQLALTRSVESELEQHIKRLRKAEPTRYFFPKDTYGLPETVVILDSPPSEHNGQQSRPVFFTVDDTQPLGDGKYGSTFMARTVKTQRRGVIKIMLFDEPLPEGFESFPSKEESFETEKRVLRMLKRERGSRVMQVSPRELHQGLHIESAYSESSYTRVGFIAQNFIEGTMLKNVNDIAVLEDARSKMMSVMESFYKHTNMAHGDISPLNVIVRSADNAPVLIDFGLAWEPQTEAFQSVQNDEILQMNKFFDEVERTCSRPSSPVRSRESPESGRPNDQFDYSMRHTFQESWDTLFDPETKRFKQ
jgi:serine/threonine protein kinase